MRRFTSVIPLALAAGLLAAGEAPAQPRPMKTRPAGVAAYQDGQQQFQEGQKVQVTREITRSVIENGVPRQVKEQVQAVVVIPRRQWVIGALGWHDAEGYNLDNLLNVIVGVQMVPSALSRVRTVINGREMPVALEPRDVITRINGMPVTTPVDLYLAIHTAANPRDMAVEFINHRDGQTMAGRISAIKLRP